MAGITPDLVTGITLGYPIALGGHITPSGCTGTRLVLAPGSRGLHMAASQDPRISGVPQIWLRGSDPDNTQNHQWSTLRPDMARSRGRGTGYGPLGSSVATVVPIVPIVLSEGSDLGTLAETPRSRVPRLDTGLYTCIQALYTCIQAYTRVYRHARKGPYGICLYTRYTRYMALWEAS